MAKKEKEYLKSYSFPESNIGSGIIPFDHVIGGKFAPGSITTIVGESATGKTTLALHIAMNLAECDIKTLYIDVEGSVSEELLQTVGAKKYLDNSLYYLRGSTFSEVEEILDYYLEEIDVEFIFIDSISYLVHDGFVNIGKSKSTNKKGISITTNNSNYDNRILGMFMKKYNAIIKKKKKYLILINQYRNKIDMQLGTILTMAGGKSLRYGSDIIIGISPIKSTGENKRFKEFKKPQDGLDLEFEIIKSNRAPAHKRIPYLLIYGRGVSNLTAVVYALMELGFLKNDNNYYKLINLEGKLTTFHGIDDMYNHIWEYLNEGLNDKIYDFYRDKVLGVD